MTEQINYSLSKFNRFIPVPYLLFCLYFVFRFFNSFEVLDIIIAVLFLLLTVMFYIRTKLMQNNPFLILEPGVLKIFSLLSRKYSILKTDEIKAFTTPDVSIRIDCEGKRYRVREIQIGPEAYAKLEKHIIGS